MYRVYRTKTFEKSYRKLKQSGKVSAGTIKKLTTAIDLLVRGATLPRTYENHALKGILKGYRECHIKGDLLLIYKLNKKELALVLVDIGSHAYLFE